MSLSVVASSTTRSAMASEMTLDMTNYQGATRAMLAHKFVVPGPGEVAISFEAAAMTTQSNVVAYVPIHTIYGVVGQPDTMTYLTSTGTTWNTNTYFFSLSLTTFEEMNFKRLNAGSVLNLTYNPSNNTPTIPTGGTFNTYNKVISLPKGGPVYILLTSYRSSSTGSSFYGKIRNLAIKYDVV